MFIYFCVRELLYSVVQEISPAQFVSAQFSLGRSYR